jgi:thiol-disulfide isomerase/thioredoxin
MKTTSLTLALMSVLALTACSQADAPRVDARAGAEMAGKAMGIKTKAVLIYADWCGSCKVLDPKLKKAKEIGPMPGLEFITLDYTDKNSASFYAQAEAAGVGEAVEKYLNGTIKTGQLLLVDVDDKKVVGEVTKTFEPSEIISALKDAIKVS